MNTIRRLTLYLFPIYLVLIEQIKTMLFTTSSISYEVLFDGIAIAGISLLFPYLSIKPTKEIKLTEQQIISINSSGANLSGNTILEYDGKKYLVLVLSWVLFSIFSVAWLFSLSDYCEQHGFKTLQYTIYGKKIEPIYTGSISFWISLVIYASGVGVTELAEK